MLTISKIHSRWWSNATSIKCKKSRKTLSLTTKSAWMESTETSTSKPFRLEFRLKKPIVEGPSLTKRSRTSSITFSRTRRREWLLRPNEKLFRKRNKRWWFNSRKLTANQAAIGMTGKTLSTLRNNAEHYKRSPRRKRTSRLVEAKERRRKRSPRKRRVELQMLWAWKRRRMTMRKKASLIRNTRARNYQTSPTWAKLELETAATWTTSRVKLCMTSPALSTTTTSREALAPTLETTAAATITSKGKKWMWTPTKLTNLPCPWSKGQPLHFLDSSWNDENNMWSIQRNIAELKNKRLNTFQELKFKIIF